MKISTRFVDAKIVSPEACSFYTQSIKSSSTSHGAVYSQKVINRTQRPLLISYRSGITTVVKPTLELSLRDNTIIILHELTNFDDKYHIDTNHQYKDGNAEMEIKANIDRSYRKDIGIANCKVQYEECLSIEDVRGSEDGCYVRSIDASITVYHENAPNVNKHPGYKKNVLWGLIETDAFQLHQKVINLAIFVIDNEQILKPYYTLLANKVVAIIPRIDLELKSGLYINGLIEANSPHTNTFPSLLHLSVDELTNRSDTFPILLWDNYSEAVEYQKRDLSVKEFLLHKEKLNKLKAELDDAKEDVKKAKDEAENVTRKAKDEASAAKQEAIAIKTKNDKVTLWITALSNIGKAVLVLVPIGIALYKLKTSSNTS